MAQEITDLADIRVPTCALESEGLFSKLPVFTVQVSSTQGRNANTSFQCRRSLHDFYKLRKRFLKKWPGLLIPVLPAKRLLALYFTENTLDRLRKRVEVFLRLASQVQELSISEEFLMFLSSAVTDFISTLKTVTVPEVSTVLINYQLMMGQECPLLSPAMLVQLAEEQLLFQSVKSRLEALRTAVKQAGKAYRAYHSCFLSFNKALMDVEHHSISCCSDGNWSGVYPGDLELPQIDPYRSIKDWTMLEIVKIDTVLEAISTRESLEKIKTTHMETILHLRDDLTRLKYSENATSWLPLKPKFEKVAEIGDKLEQVGTI